MILVHGDMNMSGKYYLIFIISISGLLIFRKLLIISNSGKSEIYIYVYLYINVTEIDR